MGAPFASYVNHAMKRLPASSAMDIPQPLCEGPPHHMSPTPRSGCLATGAKSKGSMAEIVGGGMGENFELSRYQLNRALVGDRNSRDAKSVPETATLLESKAKYGLPRYWLNAPE